MDIEINKTCTQLVAINPGARLQELQFRKCGKLATEFTVITMFGNSAKLHMCEEHKNFTINMSKMTDKEVLYRDAGVPEHVIRNTISKQITDLLINK